MRYRKDAIFIRDVRKFSTTLDRNAKVRLLVAVENMERKTKRRHCRNGNVTQPALIVLRALLFRFHGTSGLCCPSYTTLQKATGLCRQSIANAIWRLKAIRVLGVQHRLVRSGDKCRQTSNLYAFFPLPPLVYLIVRRFTSVSVSGFSMGVGARKVPLCPAFRRGAYRAVAG